MKFQISSKRRLWGKPWRKQGGPKAGCPGPVWNWVTEGYTGLWPVEAAKAARKSISQVGKLSEWVLGWRKPFRILPICTELICFSIIFLIPPLYFNTYYRPWHFSKIFHSQIPTHLSFLLHQWVNNMDNDRGQTAFSKNGHTSVSGLTCPSGTLQLPIKRQSLFHLPLILTRPCYQFVK